MDKHIKVVKTAHGTKAVLTSKTSNPGAPSTNVVDATEEFELRTLSGLISRMQLANLAGLRFSGKRDLYSVFGYEKVLDPEHFLAKYARQDIASRIIDAPPGATWANPPTLKEEGDLKTKWEELTKEIDLWGAMHRVDRLARLNQFSILLFGFDDTSDFEAPLNTQRDAKSLLYVRAIGSRQIDELSFVSDERNPRFGMPEMYNIKFDDPATKSVTAGHVTTKGLRNLKVHASRIVHVVENPLEDETFGFPIIQRVFNLLDDLLKTTGGTAEMFWLAGTRGMQADIDKDMDITPADAKALSDEIEEYQHQLRRFIRTRGVKLNVLESETPQPKEMFDVIMALISGTTGIPRRILLGSEAGQLASEQDRANWADRIAERRTLFCTPTILRPTVSLLQTVGLLPDGHAEFVWPSAFIMSPLEEGMAMAQKARAIGNISRQIGNKQPMQITSREEARDIVGLEGDLEDSDIMETVDDSQPPRQRPGASETDEEETEED